MSAAGLGIIKNIGGSKKYTKAFQYLAGGNMKSGGVGRRIGSFMAQKDMDIDMLADRTGLQVDFLKSIIEDDTYPSLGPLFKIARALDVRLGTFLDDQFSEDPLIMREKDRKSELSMLRGKDKPVDMKFYSLGKGKSDRRMEPFYVELLPESAQEKQLSSHEGEEFIVVQSGSVEVIYGDRTLTLDTGDSAYYNSIVPHYVSCVGGEKAAIYAVLYIPE